jgi:hypothetical protein
MSSRASKIDAKMIELEGMLTDMDAALVVIYDGVENQISSMIISKDPKVLIGALFESFNDPQRGKDMIDLCSSVFLSYCKANPKFATQFIQMFNKVMYGIDIN